MTATQDSPIPDTAPVFPATHAQAGPGEAAGPPAAPAAADAAAPRPALPPAAALGALQRAIALCGGQSALGSALGLSQSHVWNWLSRARVPAEHCPAIERVTLRRVRCEDLRPDVDWACLRELVR